MSLKIVDIGLNRMLDKLLTAYGTSLQLHLFKNNITPSAGDTLSTYQEATFPGYASQNVTGWTAATVASSTATATADQKTFTRNASGTAENLYGYFITDGSGNLLYAERDPAAPVGLTNNGDAYLITPKLTFKSEF